MNETINVRSSAALKFFSIKITVKIAEISIKTGLTFSNHVKGLLDVQIRW